MNEHNQSTLQRIAAKRKAVEKKLLGLRTHCWQASTTLPSSDRKQLQQQNENASTRRLELGMPIGSRASHHQLLLSNPSNTHILPNISFRTATTLYAPPANARNRTKFGSLPVEIKVRIIQALPWRYRTRIERVSRELRQLALANGWSKTTHFSLSRGGELGWRPLLARIHPFLTSLKLDRSDYGDTDFILAHCPKLEHLHIRWDHFKATCRYMLDCSHSAASRSLKSLYIRGDSSDIQTTLRVGAYMSLHQASCTLPSVELLVIGDSETICAELEYLLPVFPNLQHLSFSRKNAQQMLFAHQPISRGIAALVSMKYLRSLSLWQDVPLADLSFLEQLPQLEHLCVEVAYFNLESFIGALPHLAGCLKALEVGVLPNVGNQLILAIASHLNRLEHLGLCTASSSIKGAIQLLVDSPRMKQLRSLSIFTFGTTIDWAPLERLVRLEYLTIKGEVPLATLCNVVENCMKLRGLLLIGYKANAEDRARLLASFYERDTHGEIRPNLLVHIGQQGASTSSFFTPILPRFDGFKGPKLEFVANERDVVPVVLFSHMYGRWSERIPWLRP